MITSLSLFQLSDSYRRISSEPHWAARSFGGCGLKFRKEQPPNTHPLKVDTIPNLVNSFSTRSGETAAISIMLARRGEWHHDEIPTTAVGVIASLLQLVAVLQHTFNPANGEECILIAEADSGNSATLNPNGNGQHTEGHLGEM